MIISLDADDLLEPTAFETLLSPMDDSAVGWSAGSWQETPLDEARRLRFVPDSPGPKERGWIGTTIGLSKRATPFYMNSILYRRAAILATAGWPAFGE